MSTRRVRRPILDAGDTVIAFDANARNSVLHRIILPFAALAALLAVVAVPILGRADIPSVAVSSTLKCYDGAENPISCRADMPAVAVSSTLKCYDGAGDYAACLTGRSEPPSRVDGRTAEAHRPASETTVVVSQSANWKASLLAARRSRAPGKRPVLAICRRGSILCFFSALRRGVVHIASVAALHAARSPRTFNPQ